MRGGIDTAVIMAGGMGLRLRPYTSVLPKPLMPLGNMSVIEILIRQLRSDGINRFFISVGYLSHLVKAVLDNIEFDGAELTYFYESKPLGTCGALPGIGNALPERFLVANGDLLSDYPVSVLLEQHANSEAAITIGTQWKTESISYGVLERCSKGLVVNYKEKPEHRYELSIGLYAMERWCVEEYLSLGESADMPDLINTLLSNEIQVGAVPVDCSWIDIGKPEEYLCAQELFDSEPERFLNVR
ncbi:sugar phosphate nucleotidyltransferase [Parahaliea aestuarii]|uniref:NTP transferase domain-containing protein n=1 Tax=Parahaliea aestuarii TaxID=1852021 RepID=A0A5C8ZPC3_9GAMM|nr:sugar phosphate nucleotidyltransferase [Parahaliea aestuarii]TXS89417.1 NTP transferase domain-containing protein [Parahaliea aestuarii]